MTDFLPFHIADVTDAEIDAVVDVLKSGWLTTGARAREFETEFARFIGVKHAVAVNSATAAMHLALEAIGLKRGDEVIVPAMTFAATAEVVLYFGARPVLGDCDPETLTMRAEDIEPLITERTRAVIPVHYGGHPCDMDPILALARARGLKVIDDAAHSLPASYRGRAVGTLADATAFSFYATKTLTTGEGGMLTTDDDAIADRARIMSLHGISRHAWNRYSAEGSWRYEILAPGFKYNLTDIAAALGLVQLKRQAEITAGRARVAAAYAARLAGIDGISLPVRRDDVEHAWHLYPIRVDGARAGIDRDAMINALRQRGVGTSVHFIPLHHHPLYQQTFGYRPGDFPNADRAFEQILSLPIYPGLSGEQIERVAAEVARLAGARS